MLDSKEDNKFFKLTMSYIYPTLGFLFIYLKLELIKTVRGRRVVKKCKRRLVGRMARLVEELAKSTSGQAAVVPHCVPFHLPAQLNACWVTSKPCHQH